MTLPLGQRMDYLGDGATSTYDFTFKIFSKADLIVQVADLDGVETQLHHPDDFTVSGSTEGPWPNGGTITLTAGPLEAGYALVIRRLRPLTQTTDIRNQQAFYPESLEDTYDHLVMICQQLQEQLSRALQLIPTIAPVTVDVFLPPPEAGRVIGWNGDASGLQYYAPGSGGTTVEAGYGLEFVGSRLDTKNAEFDAGNSGSAKTINWANGRRQLLALTGNVTLTLNNRVAGEAYRLLLVQDATGGRTVTWPASVVWETGTPPAFILTANTLTVVYLDATAAGAGGYVGSATQLMIPKP